MASPGRRMASPTATAASMPCARTNSASSFPESIMVCLNGSSVSTGMRARCSSMRPRAASLAAPPDRKIFVSATSGAEARKKSSDRCSFAAVAQFAPALLGGIYWRGGTRAGAFGGLVAGFAVWAWTLMLPSVAKSGWIPAGFIDDGPFGIALLAPERLFGLTGLDYLTHSLFWSLFLNVAFYVGLSLALITILIPLAAFGVLGLAAVVLVHEVAEIFVIGNGVRAGRVRPLSPAPTTQPTAASAAEARAK